MKYLIVGLGNIGAEYELTRHNIGFLALDALAEKFECKWETLRHASKTDFKYKGRHVHLIKPTTYMNLSGKSMAYWLRELKINIDRSMVVVDELALPFGTIRIRAKGSAAGHNGLKNIEQLCGGQKYPRLRFGVGDDYPRGRQVDYVLSNFPKKEMDSLPLLFDHTNQMILDFVSIGIERTMNQHNKKSLLD